MPYIFEKFTLIFVVFGTMLGAASAFIGIPALIIQTIVSALFV